MLASSIPQGFGAGWPGVLCRGPHRAYSVASDVKSFRVCYRFRIVRDAKADRSKIMNMHFNIYKTFLRSNGKECIYTNINKKY